MKTSQVTSTATFRSIATFTFFSFASLYLISCATTPSSSTLNSENGPVTVTDEVSLKSDRAELDEARKDIPETKKRDNDEIAFVFSLIAAKSNQEPGEIRDRFNKAVRDRRDRNDKNLWQKREDFTVNERRSRDEFLKKAKETRDVYSKEKHSPDERKSFFEKQDDNRRTYFANEADKRKDFESSMTESRKTFEDYVRQQTDRFNQELKEYSTDYYERKKQEALRDRTKQQVQDRAKAMSRDVSQPTLRSGQSNTLDEFSTIPSGGPTIHLGPPTDNR